MSVVCVCDYLAGTEAVSSVCLLSACVTLAGTEAVSPVFHATGAEPVRAVCLSILRTSGAPAAGELFPLFSVL